MHKTNTLIYVPETALYVKRSLAYDVADMSSPKSPLLRSVNRKDKNGTSNRSINVRKEKLKTETSSPQRGGNGRLFIKNMTGGPIVINIPEGADEHGNRKYRQIEIGRFVLKKQIRPEYLDSFEMQNLYENGKIKDVDEATYIEEEKAYNAEQKRKEEDLRAKLQARSSGESRTINAGDREISITEDIGNREFMSEDMSNVDDSEMSDVFNSLPMGDDMEGLLEETISQPARKPRPSRPGTKLDPGKAIKRSL